MRKGHYTEEEAIDAVLWLLKQPEKNYGDQDIRLTHLEKGMEKFGEYHLMIANSMWSAFRYLHALVDEDGNLNWYSDGGFDDQDAWDFFGSTADLVKAWEA